MEDREIKVILKKLEDKDSLVFYTEDDNPIEICLNTDDQSKLKELFFVIIQDLLKNNIELVLEIEKDYDVKIFIEVAQEYIQALNEEIKSVKLNLPKKGD